MLANLTRNLTRIGDPHSQIAEEQLQMDLDNPLEVETSTSTHWRHQYAPYNDQSGATNDLTYTQTDAPLLGQLQPHYVRQQLPCLSFNSHTRYSPSGDCLPNLFDGPILGYVGRRKEPWNQQHSFTSSSPERHQNPYHQHTLGVAEGSQGSSRASAADSSTDRLAPGGSTHLDATSPPTSHMMVAHPRTTTDLSPNVWGADVWNGVISIQVPERTGELSCYVIGKIAGQQMIDP